MFEICSSQIYLTANTFFSLDYKKTRKNDLSLCHLFTDCKVMELIMNLLCRWEQCDFTAQFHEKVKTFPNDLAFSTHIAHLCNLLKIIPHLILLPLSGFGARMTERDNR